uniref:Succinate dehydrogenase assembly factor 3 n=1 Tax=Albugo laibachii Nc14 TaxID=890382 RepID=F0X1K3_9STRA|nr:conserved hypothetical protein [Albugo laibachii Nc14]|eukprot:CCA27695.1 conserved hypothetical protein [Albugo laibachii Nc14]
MPHRHDVLRLYKNILTLHQSQLDPQLRVIGDQYVREEFKRHKNATTEYISSFLTEWKQYEETLRLKSKTRIGENLDKSMQSMLSEEQKTQLRNLKETAGSLFDSSS